MAFSFWKMSGSGNDFILADNRDGAIQYEDMPALATRICERKISVGADGLILIENGQGVEFMWRFFNADGSEAEMCGNGSRCAARFALENHIAGRTQSFLTLAGVIRAEVLEGSVKVRLTRPENLLPEITLDVDGSQVRVFSVNTGVPHAVVRVTDLENTDVDGLGRKIRFHPRFAPAGTNVNFLAVENGQTRIRTYERGVEGETLACGTGAVASALCRAAAGGVASPVQVLTRGGGVLTIHFTKTGDAFDEVYLEGDARIIYRAELGEDA
ncbi:MAG: diaminopimelate epimerase [Pseudomonadota bacterium]